MARLTKCHEIFGVMRAAIGQGNYMVDFFCCCYPPLTSAHFAQRMGSDEPAPDGWPRAVVPLLHFWRPLISVVPGSDQPFVIRAVRFVG